MAKFGEKVMRIFKGEGEERKKVLEPIRREETPETTTETGEIETGGFSVGQSVKVPRGFDEQTGKYSYVDESGWVVTSFLKEPDTGKSMVRVANREKGIYKNLYPEELREFNQLPQKAL